jgi:hypothetical protein
MGRSIPRRALQLLVLPLFALVLWFPINTFVEAWPLGVVNWLFVALMIGVAAVVFPAVVVGSRGAFARPFVALSNDTLSIHDSCTLRSALRLQRTEIAEVRSLDPFDLPSDSMGWSYAEISPFPEPMTVELVFREQHRMVEARSGIFGNWLWLYTRRADARLPRVPEQGQLYDAVRLRTSANGTERLRTWLSE